MEHQLNTYRLTIRRINFERSLRRQRYLEILDLMDHKIAVFEYQAESRVYILQ